MSKEISTRLLLILLALQCLLVNCQHVAQTRYNIMNGRTPVRGVVIGGWLIAEYWQSTISPLWTGVPENIASEGEYSVMKHLGHAQGDARFDHHWNSFITEQDFAEMASYGLNTVRIPIGFWIVGFDNSQSDPNSWQVYAPGGLKYLDRVISEWAPRHNIVVIISMHAAKGSQNGNHHSAPQTPGQANWYTNPENIANTLDVVQFLAARYREQPAFLGISLMNEPNKNEYWQVLQRYYYDAYIRVRNYARSDCILYNSPTWDQQTNMPQWTNFMLFPQYYNVQTEWHKYTVWGFETEKGWNTDNVMNYVRTTLRSELSYWRGTPMFIGEWSLATRNLPMTDEQLKQFARDWLDTFSLAMGGWTFCTWKFYDPKANEMINHWSMKALIKLGVLPNRFT